MAPVLFWGRADGWPDESSPCAKTICDPRRLAGHLDHGANARTGGHRCCRRRVLDDAPMVYGDCGINQIAAQRPQARQNPVLAGPGKPRIADDVGYQDRCQFSFRPRRYAAETVSAVSGRRGKSIIGFGMAAHPCCTREDVEAGSAALRVDWPVYPRRAEHNTVAEGGNRRWAETARPIGGPASVWPGRDGVGCATRCPEGDKRPRSRS